MDPASKEKTAFVTQGGLFEFEVMPFGLCNALATFQRLMSTVLVGLVPETCLVYIDDIIVMGRSFEEHLTNLGKVLQRLREAGLKLKPQKCYFLKDRVEYLGHIVSAEGVGVDPRKTQAVREFPQPLNLKALRSLLGLASYYRRFIPKFSSVAAPLHALTRKNTQFVWTPTCQQAFDHLKQLMTDAPVLAYPDFEQPFLLETDASGTGLGAVLAQRQEEGSVRPVAYASRTLQNHEKNYGVTELEGLGVVWATKHFRPYLYGHPCDVYTDHEVLKALLNTPQPSGKLARWGLALQELDLTIHYRPGKKNANADALSRSPLLPAGDEPPVAYPFGIIGALAPVTTDPVDPTPTLQQQQRSDPVLAVIRFLEDGDLPIDEKRARELALTKSQYSILEGVLYHIEPDKTLRIIPAECQRRGLFEEVHAGKFGGHLRDAKISGELSRHYWWAGMRGDVLHWCRACLTCASRRVGRAANPLSLLYQLQGRSIELAWTWCSYRCRTMETVMRSCSWTT